jgi:hypothetical protein
MRQPQSRPRAGCVLYCSCRCGTSEKLAGTSEKLIATSVPWPSRIPSLSATVRLCGGRVSSEKLIANSDLFAKLKMYRSVVVKIYQ